MAISFHTPSHLIERRVRVLLIGAGGTGGEVLYALARMHKLLLTLGHPGGLHVTVMDGDRVAAPNIGRQRFAECDIGHFKTDVLVQRLNLFFGSDWESAPEHWTPKRPGPRWHHTDLIVSCVDRAKVRVQLAQAAARLGSEVLWLDFGNGEHTGQCVLGHPGESDESASSLRLPTVVDLFPELSRIEDKNTPSCSAAEAIRQQDLFTNALLAEAGVSLLWKLFRHGSTQTHGVLADAREPSIEPMLIDPDTWRMYGYDGPSKTPSLRTSHAKS